jgi:hypothetical protein
VYESLRTTAVDWIKPTLATAVIAIAAAPHARAFKPLFIKVFIVAISRFGSADLPHAGRRRHGVIYNYITT